MNGIERTALNRTKMDKYCINHYVGATCNNIANPKNICYDGCGWPLIYCDKCWAEFHTKGKK